MDKKTLKNIAAILALAAAIAAAWWVIACRCVDLNALTPAGFRDYIRGFGSWAAVVYVLAYALNTVSIMPPIGVLSLAAGLAFGKPLGALLLMTGAVLGTSITFLISRVFGRAFIEKRMRGRFKELDDLLEKNGFAAILFFRAIPLVPYEVLNYTGGFTRIKFRDYFFATFLGIIPGVIISAFFGGALGELKAFKDLFSFKFIAALAALLLLILVPVIYRRLKKKGDSHGI